MMITNKKIQCSNCNHEIDISDAVLSPFIEEQTKQMEKKQKELDTQLVNLSLQLKKVEEDKVKAKEELEQSLKEERKKIEKELITKVKKEAKLEASEELKELQEQLNEKTNQIQSMKKLELQLRKEKESLADQKQNLDLEVLKQVSQEKERIKREAKEQALQESMLSLADKDKKLADMAKQIDELKRKSELGSQQSQGEVLEIILRDSLQQVFPMDTVTDVPKGVNGGDCVQKVFHNGLHCGTILWESKRTKHWSNEWLSKVKDDQRSAQADLSIIVSQSLPNEVSSFTCIDGVWVCSLTLYQQLVAVLRTGLIEIYNAKNALLNKSSKMDIMYSYLTGATFKNRIEGVIEPFKYLKDSLEKERRALTKAWAEREQQINRAMLSAAGMYGDLQGIVGTDLIGIENLELLEETK